MGCSTLTNNLLVRCEECRQWIPKEPDQAGEVLLMLQEHERFVCEKCLSEPEVVIPVVKAEKQTNLVLKGGVHG